MRNQKFSVVLAVAAALGLASCQEFFTTSLGKWAERDASVPSNLTQAQALSIAQTALESCDTDLAAALLPQLEAMATTGSASDEVVEAAVDTAILSTGVSEAFGDALASLGSDLLSISSVTDLSAEQEASLVSILESVTVSQSAFDMLNYVDGMSASDLEDAGVTAADCAMAAAALYIAAVEAESGTVTVEELLNGTASWSAASVDYRDLAASLLSTASGLSGGTDIYSLIDGLM